MQKLMKPVPVFAVATTGKGVAQTLTLAESGVWATMAGTINKHSPSKTKAFIRTTGPRKKGVHTHQQPKETVVAVDHSDS